MEKLKNLSEDNILKEDELYIYKGKVYKCVIGCADTYCEGCAFADKFGDCTDEAVKCIGLDDDISKYSYIFKEVPFTGDDNDIDKD